MRHRALLVEDEQLVGTMVEMNLASDGFDVTWITDGEEALARALETSFDVILLDISLPGADGMRILQAIRAREINTPVLMLTARGDVATKVDAFDLGADDYLAKPFNVSELTARVRALVRRSQADRAIPSNRIIEFGRYRINLVTREAQTNEGPVVLSEKEAAFMELMFKACGSTLSRSDILDEVWGMDSNPTVRTVDNLVLRLRKLFEAELERPRHILTVRGVGYRFKY